MLMVVQMETKTTTQDPLNYNAVASQLENSVARMSADQQLEIDFLKHQQLRRAAETPLETQETFTGVEQLSDHVQNQMANIRQRVMDITGVSEDLLQARQDRIAIRFVDQEFIEGEKVNGAYDGMVGTATIVNNRHPGLHNHGVLHEITHGLLQSGSLYNSGEDNRIRVTGNGVSDFMFNNGEMLTPEDADLMNSLRDINEGIVDILALDQSDVMDEAYLNDAKGGYSVQTKTMRQLFSSHPEIAQDMITAAVVNGVESKEQAKFFVDTYDKVKGELQSPATE